jgi:ATP-dependent RNA helicase DBP3
MDAVLKAAKKALKKEDEMKLSDLTKTVLSKLDDDASLSKSQVKEWISESSKFVVDGKLVRLQKKTERSVTPSEEDVSDKKKQKKQKTDSAMTEATATTTTTTTTSSSTAAADSTDIPAWRKEHKIVIMHATDDSEKTIELNADATYFPHSTFEAARSCLNPALIQQCTKGNTFTHPTPIQAQSWPLLCASKDVVGIAETGSGKTLGFALPALSNMAAANNGKASKYPRMLVLAPTRELAMQSHVVLEEFGAVVGLGSLVVYGGVPKFSQISALKQGGVDCLVATPGRLKDLIEMGACNLSQIQYLVLDEADRMLDMGFEQDVRSIISNCPSKNRQTCMFSATWPVAIRNIAMEFMSDPVRVYVGFEAIVSDESDGITPDDSLSANKRVQLLVEVVEDRQRDARLRQILKQVHDGKNRVLIFALYKKEAERLEFSLRRDGYNVCSIHGNKHQAARTEALASFKDASCPLMVATDVAARGLDIPNVEVVINFTFPLTIEDFIHRGTCVTASNVAGLGNCFSNALSCFPRSVGRTGRAGKTGVSYTFFQPGDKSHAGELQQVIRQAGQEVPEDLMKFGSTIKKKEHKMYGAFGPTGITKKATRIVFD